MNRTSPAATGRKSAVKFQERHCGARVTTRLTKRGPSVFVVKKKKKKSAGVLVQNVELETWCGVSAEADGRQKKT